MILRAEQSRAEQSRAEQSRAEQSRARYLDIAKGIGISLVVLGHLLERTQFLRILIYSFHMPLFFIISGSLNKKSTLSQCFKKGFRKLVIPVYQILAFDALLKILKCMVKGDVYPSLTEWINGLLIHGGILWNAPVWFLMTLFMCRLAICFCDYLNEKITFVFVAGCIFICTFSVNTKFPQWWLTNVIMSFPFFWYGMRKKPCNIFKNSRKKNILFIILSFMLILVARWNGYTDINIQCNGKNYLLFLFTGIAGTWIVVELSKWIEKLKISNVLELVGKNSFIILLSHYYICRGIIPEGIKYLKISSNYVLQIFLAIIIIGTYYCIFKIKQREKEIGY